MARYKFAFVLLQAISFCFCEIDFQKKNKLVNGFIEFYNSLPNEIYTCDEGYLQSAQQTDISNAYDIRISLKVSYTQNIDIIKYLICTATVADVDLIGVAVMKHQCQDDPSPPLQNPVDIAETVTSEPDVVTEAAFVRRPIQLDNEVQTDTAVTSGEQFIAIPREEPKIHCIGCSSHVNPQAQGVDELAAIGVRQLNSLEPTIQHTLTSVVDVERQVQVVNGVRYILTLLIDYNSCPTQETEETDPCLMSKACKITILEKPWMQLPDGSKYRAILSNNCTEEWRFGDDGVVVPTSDNKENNNINPMKPDGGSDMIEAVYNVGLQSQQQTEITLTDEDIKNLEEQIIPLNQFIPGPTVSESSSPMAQPPDISKEHVVKIKSENQYSLNSIETGKPQNVEILDDDKKKSINELLNFFNFAGFESNTNLEKINDANLRTKRGLQGGQVEKDPNDSVYKSLAEESLQTYLQSTGNTKLHKVVRINRVTTQVVAGSLTRIDFTIAPAENGTDHVRYCHSEIWERPWLKSKNFVVNCSIDEIEMRAKRSLPGGIQAVDSKNPQYRHLAEMSLQKYLKESNILQPHEVLNIEKVERQVVSGLKTVIHFKIAPKLSLGDVISCRSEIWEQPWENKTEITVNCEENSHIKQIVNTKRNKRNADKLFGGEQEEDATEEEFKYLAEDALKKYDKKQKTIGKHAVVKVKRVTKKIIAGTIYKIDFTAAPNSCSHDLSLCEEENPLLNCNAVMKFYAWKSQNDIDVSCKKNRKRNKRRANLKIAKGDSKFHQPTEIKILNLDNREKRQAEVDVDPARTYDVTIQKMLKESLEKLEMTTPQRYKQKVLKVNSYSTRVTSGKVATIDFDVAFTSCLKYEWVDDIESCGLLEHLPRRHCIAEVWERLRLDNGRNIEVSCKDEVAPLEQHVESESATTAMAFANQGLKHIEAKYPHPRKQKIVRIFSMDKQVVAGIHYRMKMEVGLTNCSALSGDSNCVIDRRASGENKFCRVNVWVQPSTDHPPNYRVTCDSQEGAMTDLFHQMQAEHLFRDFLATYNPEYVNDHDEMLKRFEVFKANVRKIHDLNTHERGSATYGVTRFADLTYEEFAKKHTGLKPNLQNTNQVPMRKAQIPNVKVPETFDWREHGAVTEVKDQGACGSCWAFSVTGNIEGQWQLKSGKLVSLSEQELVDCDKMDDGCNGGLPDNAYRAIEQLGGLETEADYPYEGEDDKCAFNKSLSRVKITSAVNITSNETDMVKWLVQNGPISIGINANAMQFYMGGVSHPWKMLCSPKNLDHGVLIVGYGVKNYPLFHKRLPYWIVKNSWGPSWGEQGYYRVFRGDGTCGVNQMASSAVI